MTTKVDYDFLGAMKNGSLIERLFYRKKIEGIKNSIQFKNGQRVLDLGCGTGLVTFNLPNNINIIAADLSRWCIRKMLQHQKEHGKFFEVVIGDGFDLPFKDSLFDVIILADVIEHIPNRGKLIEDVARVLKRGGKVLVTVPWKYHPVWHFDRLRKLFSRRTDIDTEDIHESFDKKKIIKTFGLLKLEKYKVICYLSETLSVLKKP